MTKSPAFQFYAAEFLADENVVCMTNQEVGCYIKLMSYCWREGSIPSCISRISKLCGEDSSAMAQLWLSIAPCFTLAIDDELRLVHPRLEKERVKQSEHKKERSESGAKGAEARWGKELRGYSSAIAKPIAEPMANDGSSSSSSSSSSNNIYTAPIGAELLKAYMKVRKAKRAGEYSEIAFKATEREAKKAGLTVEQAITVCIERSWQNFNAEWYKKPDAAESLEWRNNDNQIVRKAVAMGLHTQGKTRFQLLAEIDMKRRQA